MDALIDQSGNDRRQSRGLSTIPLLLSLPPPSPWISHRKRKYRWRNVSSKRSRGRSSGARPWKNVTYSRRKWIYNGGGGGGGRKKFLTRRATPFPFSLTKNIGKFSAGFICSEFNVPLLQERPPPLSSFTPRPLLPICGERGSMVYRGREKVYSEWILGWILSNCHARLDFAVLQFN